MSLAPGIAASSRRRAAVVVEPATDANWDNVAFLAHFDGVDGSTSFPEVTGKTITPSGNAQVDTAESKFGGGSLILHGNGDNLSTPDHADFAFGSRQFTIEMWVNFASVSSAMTLFSQYNNSTNDRSILLHYRGSDATKVLRFVWYDAAQTAAFFDYAWTPTLGQWYHIAVDRDATKMRMYVDGVMVADAADTTTIHDSSEVIRIGAVYSSGITQFFNGHIDDVRITTGVARYASDAGFAVPTAAFPDSGPASQV